MLLRSVLRSLSPQTAIELLYPRLCFSCAKNRAPRAICPACLGEFERVPADRIYSETVSGRLNLNHLRKLHALWMYDRGGGVQRIHRSFKFEGQFRVGEAMGNLIGELLGDAYRGNLPDVIIPVPLAKVRELDRGYNQSFALATGIAAITGLPIETAMARRPQATLRQSDLDLSKRRTNMRSAFEVERLNVGTSILLIDDIVTTGSTLDALAFALLEAGARWVDAAAFAFTRPV